MDMREGSEKIDTLMFPLLSSIAHGGVKYKDDVRSRWERL
jgi:hypothetical protein